MVGIIISKPIQPIFSPQEMLYSCDRFPNYLFRITGQEPQISYKTA